MGLTTPGRYFYHYTTWDVASGAVLPCGQLRLSPFYSMKDPLEAEDPVVGAGVTHAPGDDEAIRQSGVAHDEAQALIRRVRRNSKLLSLGMDAPWAQDLPEPERRFGMGWARASMWQHYAEDHRGVCLIFNREKLTCTVGAQLTERHPDSRSGAVRYSQTGLAAEYHRTLLLDGTTDGAEQGRQHLRRYAREYFFVKLIDWEHEHEFRFVQVSEEDGYSFVDCRAALLGMMLGHRFPSTAEDEAVDLACKAGIAISQISWQFNGPMVDAPRAKTRRDYKLPDWLNPDTA